MTSHDKELVRRLLKLYFFFPLVTVLHGTRPHVLLTYINPEALWSSNTP